MRHDIRQMTIPTVCQALDEDANYKFSEKYPDGKQFFQASKRQVPSFSVNSHPSVNLPVGKQRDTEEVCQESISQVSALITTRLSVYLDKEARAMFTLPRIVMRCKRLCSSSPMTM